MLDCSQNQPQRLPGYAHTLEGFTPTYAPTGDTGVLVFLSPCAYYYCFINRPHGNLLQIKGLACRGFRAKAECPLLNSKKQKSKIYFVYRSKTHKNDVLKSSQKTSSPSARFFFPAHSRTFF